MDILAVTSEFFPLMKTGGLADVAGALPAALRSHDMTMTTLLPGYPIVMEGLNSVEIVHHYQNFFGGEARLLISHNNHTPLIVLDAPHLYKRPGNPYLSPQGKDWSDNAMRFAALARSAADIGRGIIPHYSPQLLHLHDWQAALASVYLSEEQGPKTLLTIHNIAFQGQFPRETFPHLDLPSHRFTTNCLEYYGGLCFMKGGITCADAITTVSPTYAEEICTPEYGMGLEGVLRTRRNSLHGIVNGIDEEIWNPKTDARISSNYDCEKIKKRFLNKLIIERRFGLERDDGILHAIVSRLTWQKGLDIFLECIDSLMASGARVAVIGQGEPELESAFYKVSERYRGRIGLYIGYDESLAHMLFSGADTILVPSRFEPCGLTQLYGLRYGCVPIVSRTGGLADTVIDANHAALRAGVATGFQFSPLKADTLLKTLQRAQRLYSDRVAWETMQRQGMRSDVSWQVSATAYAAIYRSLVQTKH